MKDIIDISDWQEGINFDDIVKRDVHGVIIKISEGTAETTNFETFLEECVSHKLPWGVYVFTHAKSPEMAQAEADACITYLGGRVPNLGIWFDVEDKNVLSIGDVTDICSAFICRLNELGLSAGIYAGYYTLRDNIRTNDLADYVHYWMPQYDSDSCDFAEVCNGHLAGWQYTESEQIGDFTVDMNEWYD
jgi:GH25 family lysozyme M1 (1,4-beta-N-acetylmuramidase)